MADFVAVLKKTIDGLGDTTPEMRRRVYDKARATVAAKLAALDPQPPASVAERQRKALEDAVVEIEASFAPPADSAQSDPMAELEKVFASLNSKPAPAPAPSIVRSEPPKPLPAAAPKPPIVIRPQAADRAADAPEGEAPKSAEAPKATVPPPPAFIKRPAPPTFIKRAEPPANGVDPAKPEEPPVKPQPPSVELQEPSAPVQEPPAKPDLSSRLGESTVSLLEPSGADDEPIEKHDEFDPMSLPTDSGEEMPEYSEGFTFPPSAEEIPEIKTAPRRRPIAGALISAAVALAVIGGLAATWLYREQITAFATSFQKQSVATQPEQPSGLGVLPPPEAPPASAQANGEPQAPKFTQRLNNDGSETDPGPAGGEVSVGEGTSISAASSQDDQPQEAPGAEDQTAATDDTGAPNEAAGTNGETLTAGVSNGATAQTPPPAQVSEGQNAIFYEERTASAPGSAESGRVVWSLVHESPGNDLPAEAAIRGEATISSKNLQLRMTIRRNADQTLPASHIIELIFLTPEDFGGGGIDNILRFTLKDTEEAPGSPVMGIPAKIADGFFLIALNESKQEMDVNLNLLRRENWIDVPVIYKNGRRALITLEKGIPGTKIFEEALQAWQNASAITIAP